MKTYLYFRTYWGKNSTTGMSGRNVLARSKMELVRTCIKSFELDTVEDIHTCACVDDSTIEYAEFLESVFDEVFHTSEGFDINDHRGKWPVFGGMGSAKYLYDYIQSKNHGPDDIILIVEDDYLFQEGGFLKWINACRELDGLVSPFDHPDRYLRNDDRYFRKTEIKLVDNHHWRNIESSTGTIGSRYKFFKRTLFLRRVPRFYIWFFWPSRILGKELPSIDRVFCRRAYFWLRIKLYSPIPGLATHLSRFIPPRNISVLKKDVTLPETQLSPGVDWAKRFHELGQ